ncbi:cytochrome P450 [Amniculicola lignicola CBS 123094]|uniref:Cytochrome P450 n=1 Tax=Amniculicola lignicola CBS 123094 TaxID=1392246 RepID=A0A6A5W1K4_9PLEO|nr:cytochrome P450 [Amniculicola lignicola CBS 123094]
MAFEQVEESPRSLSSTALRFILLATLLLLWGTSLAIYRLFFSPLSKFPGPKLAAVTGWVETYHDVFRGGQLIFKLGEWHEEYGPIVRINPWEVHIADPDFVQVLFASNSQFDKKIEWKYRTGIPHSSFDTIEHQHHRMRRSAVAPFFSKQKILGITDFISQKAQRLCDRLETEFAGSGRPAILNNCFTAMTFDVITHYAFARSFEYMEDPNFEAPFTNAAKELATTLHTMGHFPWLLSLLQGLPQKWSVAMNPAMGAIFGFHGEIEDQIRAIKSGSNDAHKDVEHKTVFSELLNSDLPTEEKAVERLKHEGKPTHLHTQNTTLTCPGGSIVAGGVETTSTALSKATFYVLENPAIATRLRAELDSVFPDPRITPSLATLEALPYLSAIVNETLRITIGISSRTARKSRKAPIIFKDIIIPAGADFSMTAYYTHTDPRIWDKPHEFVPERWLGKALAKNDEPLSKYLVAFSKGPRMCLGINLARAELYIGMAVVFRRLELELFETGRAAVEMKADYFIPFPDRATKGVRVLVK